VICTICCDKKYVNICMLSDHSCHVEQIEANQSSDYDKWPPLFFLSFIFFVLGSLYWWHSLVFFFIAEHQPCICTYSTGTRLSSSKKKKLISFFYWFETYMCVLRFSFLSDSYMNGNRTIVIGSSTTYVLQLIHLSTTIAANAQVRREG